jgi:hypothetical protein
MILLCWLIVMTGFMELFPVIKPFVREYWYYAGGLGALYLFYIDVRHRNSLIGNVLYYFFAVIAGPAMTATVFTYYAILYSENRKKQEVAG